MNFTNFSISKDEFHYKTRLSYSVLSQSNSTRGNTDTDTGILPGIPESAICVQDFDDSLNSAIRITYRSSQRSSSMCEPRHPLLKVV